MIVLSWLCALGVLLHAAGDAGRGRWSQTISIIGGWLWIVPLIAIFFFDWLVGLVFLGSSFIAASILKGMFRLVFRWMTNLDSR